MALQPELGILPQWWWFIIAFNTYYFSNPEKIMLYPC